MKASTVTALTIGAMFGAMFGGMGIGGYSRWVEPLPDRPAESEASQAATMTAAEAKRARKKAARLKGTP